MTTGGNLIKTTLALVAILAAASPARAGIGSSESCSDGVDTELPILTTPITLGVETGAGGSHLALCYSTTGEADPTPAVTGGRILVDVDGARVHCTRDASPTLLGVECFLGDTPAGHRLVLILNFQSVVVRVETGLDDVACLRDTVVTTSAGTAGPLDIGVCA